MARIKMSPSTHPYTAQLTTGGSACAPTRDGLVTATMSFSSQSDITKGDHKTPLSYDAAFFKGRPGMKGLTLRSGSCRWRTESYPIALSVYNILPPQYCSWFVGGPELLSNIRTSAPATLKNNARNQALSRIHPDKLEFSTELLEFRSSLRTLGDLARDLSSLANMVNKTGNGFIEASIGFRRYKDIFDHRDRKRLQNLLDPAQKWLMLQFGLKPIVDSASKVIDRLSNDKFFSDKLTITTSGRSKLPYTSPPRSVNGYRQVDEGTIYYRTGCKYRVSNPTMYSLSSLGLSPFDVIKSIYDVIPWSFLVEWGLGFGRALRGISATSGLIPLVGYDTTFNKGVSSLTDVNEGIRDQLISYTIMNRRVIPSIQPPSILKGVDHLGSWHAITGAALASTTVLRYRNAKVTGT